MKKKKANLLLEQSAVIPFLLIDNQPWLLLISSRHNKHWGIPKGRIMKQRNALQSAEKEALEEAGIQGAISPFPVGKYQYKKHGSSFEVEVFLLEIHVLLEQWEEKKFRKRKLIPMQECERWIPIVELQSIIQNTIPIVSITPKPISSTLASSTTFQQLLEQSSSIGKVVSQDQTTREMEQLQQQLANAQQIQQRQKKEMIALQQQLEQERKRLQFSELRLQQSERKWRQFQQTLQQSRKNLENRLPLS